jgi:nucleoside-diphosphate-sugar epimerase
LVDDGFRVTVVARSDSLPEELKDRGVVLARGERSGSVLEAAIGAGADVVVDVIPYTTADADQLVGLADRVGSVIAISSASVYVDDAGRSMDAATGADDFPRLPVPVTEKQPTVSPGADNYSARKVAIEQRLLHACPAPVTIVRPCAVYGVGARSLREWYFIRRVLDGRPRVVLPNAGRSVFHTTAAENIAELVRLAARAPGAGALNCGDPDPPTVGRIARTVAELMGHHWDEVHLPGPSADGVGESPWEAAHPVVLDMSYAAARLAYRPAVAYEQGLRRVCEWLRDELSRRPWQEVLPEESRFGDDLFNYAAEDAL